MFLFVKLFSITTIFILVCYIVGATITALLRFPLRERFFALFLNLTIGLSTIVSTYAVFCTHGDTVQSAILVLVLIASWLISKQVDVSCLLPASSKKKSRTGASVLPVLLILMTSLFCLQYFVLYDSASEYLKTPFGDYVYYSRLSLPLNHLGLETNSLEVIYPQFLSKQPYHYFEIWLNALLVRVTGLPSAWVLFISTTASLLTIICIGFNAVFAHFQLRTIWALILSLLFLFVTGIRWPFLHNDFVAQGALLSSTLLHLQPKLAPVYIFMILVALLLLNRHYVAAGTVLAVIPLSFISTTPSIGGGAVTLAGYLLLTRQISPKNAFYMVLPVVLSVLYIIIFYTLGPKPYHFPIAGQSFLLQSIIPKLSEAKTIFNIAVGVFLNYIIYFVIYAVLLALIMSLRHQPKFTSGIPSIIWIWFGASLIAGAIMRALGTHYLDSFQFFSNTMLPLTPVVLAIMLAVSLHRAETSMYLLATGGLLVLLTINFLMIDAGVMSFSPEFMRKISQVSSQMGFRGAYILANTDYQNAYTLSGDSYTAGNYISNIKNDYALVSLSELDICNINNDARFQRDSAQAGQIVRKSTLYRFAKFKSLNHQNISLDSIKYKFIVKNKIGFICTSKKAVLPTILQSLVKKVYIDKLSGERFYLLNTDKDIGVSNAYN